jgi:hypothetical protein
MMRAAGDLSAVHGHDPKKCDVLVCWRHNWKECPEEIGLVELSKIFGTC